MAIQHEHENEMGEYGGEGGAAGEGNPDGHGSEDKRELIGTYHSTGR